MAAAPSAPVRTLAGWTVPICACCSLHAHPDDEVIQTGIVMARYADEGAGVTLVTCTLGEEGEVLVPDLVHLAAGDQDRLGEHRIGELADGDGHHRRHRPPVPRWAGPVPGLRDDLRRAGHAAARAEIRPDSFWQADLLDAATDLVAIIREIRPQVLVTEDQFGSYGHPDHVKAHRVAMYAAAMAAAPTFRPDLGEPWPIAKIYWTARPESQFRAMIRAAREAGDLESWGGVDPDGEMPIRVTPDALIAARIHEPALVGRKVGAMRAHRTQIEPDGDFFRGGDAGWATECFVLVAGDAGPPGPDGSTEDDLFAGLR